MQASPEPPEQPHEPQRAAGTTQPQHETRQPVLALYLIETDACNAAAQQPPATAWNRSQSGLTASPRLLRHTRLVKQALCSVSAADLYRPF